VRQSNQKAMISKGFLGGGVPKGIRTLVTAVKELQGKRPRTV
jgi:hypothetical protein